MKVANRAWLLLMFVISTVGCGGPAVFSESGTGNGGSGPFDLSAGGHRIEYHAVDREPYFGCIFGIALVAPLVDPLAPGQVVTQTSLIAVEPRGQVSGELVTPSVREGSYFFNYLGDRPCDWTVSID